MLQRCGGLVNLALQAVERCGMEPLQRNTEKICLYAECVLYFKFLVGPFYVSGRADKRGCNR